MLVKQRSPERRQLVKPTVPLTQFNKTNPSPARAPADRPSVKRAWSGNEQSHEPNLAFPRFSYPRVNFHLARLPSQSRSPSLRPLAAEDHLTEADACDGEI